MPHHQPPCHRLNLGCMNSAEQKIFKNNVCDPVPVCLTNKVFTFKRSLCHWVLAGSCRCSSSYHGWWWDDVLTLAKARGQHGQQTNDSKKVSCMSCVPFWTVNWTEQNPLIVLENCRSGLMGSMASGMATGKTLSNTLLAHIQSVHCSKRLACVFVHMSPGVGFSVANRAVDAVMGPRQTEVLQQNLSVHGCKKTMGQVVHRTEGAPAAPVASAAGTCQAQNVHGFKCAFPKGVGGMTWKLSNDCFQFFFGPQKPKWWKLV